MASMQAVRRGILGTFTALMLVGLGADAARTVTGLSVGPPHRHRPIIIREVREGSASSLNWSGYAVTGAAGSVTDVQGSWIVPAIQGTCGSTNQYSSFWVGIDGFNSNTVEQTGTDSDCQSGQPVYYAWFEFYPHPLFIINNLAVKPGDVMSAEVQYKGRQFTATITNQSTGQSFSTSTRLNGAQRSSAEWIVEAPSSAGGILPLADFGTASLGGDYTAVGSTNYATISSSTGPIGSFGASNVYQTTMVTNGGATKAAPSALTSDGTSFTDTWSSAGP
jgi:hypothetical protein